MTDVIFRVDTDGGTPQVVAVFPAEPWNMRCDMTCYAHIGQHSSCSFGWYRKTRPATPEEYGPLKAELERIGYQLTIRHRITATHDAARMAAAKGA